MPGRDFFFTSESVTEGHPDKICDQISDAVLDDVIRQDSSGRVACETFITVGLVIVGGEITTEAYVDLPKLVRNLIKNVGYTNPAYGFHYDSCAILNAIGSQSPDIAQGVHIGAEGYQGLMVGYAGKETPEFMPLPIMLAHKLCKRLAEVRKKKILGFLGPDGKSQVTVEYNDGKPRRVDCVVLSTQHTEEILDPSGNKITEESKHQLIETVIKPIIEEKFLDEKTRFLINPTGKFLIGGPQSDTGMTGRKIIVDTYGGRSHHGGGAFSGKDPTKVDRSACYMTRYIAKNIVAAGLADKCTMHLAYAIGVTDPISVMVETYGTGKIPNPEIIKLIKKNFELTPQGIIQMLDLRRPIYKETAAYGHFGRNEPSFTWERLDKVKELQRV
jgi:S-adenosylmethionine synthetase